MRLGLTDADPPGAASGLGARGDRERGRGAALGGEGTSVAIPGATKVAVSRVGLGGDCGALSSSKIGVVAKGFALAARGDRGRGTAFGTAFGATAVSAAAAGALGKASSESIGGDGGLVRRALRIVFRTPFVSVAIPGATGSGVSTVELGGDGGALSSSAISAVAGGFALGARGDRGRGTAFGAAVSAAAADKWGDASLEPIGGVEGLARRVVALRVNFASVGGSTALSEAAIAAMASWLGGRRRAGTRGSSSAATPQTASTIDWRPGGAAGWGTRPERRRRCGPGAGGSP